MKRLIFSLAAATAVLAQIVPSETVQPRRNPGTSSGIAIPLAAGISVIQYGGDPTGTTDSSAAITAATNAANGAPVYFPPGLYKVTGPLAGITVWKINWVGAKTEKGCNAYGANSRYADSIIHFTDTTAADFLVSRYDAATPHGGNIGPFEFSNLLFVSSGASGFQLGAPESMDPTVTDRGTEKYVFRPYFHDCGFQWPVGLSAASGGGLTRSGSTIIHLTKAFEAQVQNCSFCGGDSQIRTWGCDKPTFDNIRTQSGTIPFDFNGSGTFGQQYVVDNVEAEGWGFTVISNNGVALTVNGLSQENDDAQAGAGVVPLTSLYGYTARVTAGSSAVVFSSPMAGILFPNYSLIQLTNGSGQTVMALVTRVDGTAVTLAPNLNITWSDSAAAVNRIHGYGPLAHSAFGTNITNCNAGPARNTPAFAWVVNQGAMNLTNCTATGGSYQAITSVVIGNQMPATYAISQAQMSFNGCSPLVCADASNPFVRVANWSDPYGTGAGFVPGSDRPKSGDGFDEFSKTARRWSWTPKTAATAVNKWNLFPFVQVPGDANTSERVWAWDLPGSASFGLRDESILSVTPGSLHLFLRAKAIAGASAVAISALGNGGENIATVSVSGPNWNLYEFTIPIPSCWQGTKTSLTGLKIGPTGNGIYLAAVGLEEDTEANATETFTNKTFGDAVVAPSYTVATLPQAARYPCGLVFVTDAVEAAGAGIGSPPRGGGSVKRVVYSTGSAWLLL